jgi:hypothetical protein
MAVTATPIFPQALKTTLIQFAPGDTTVEKDILTAGANGTKIENIIAYSTDTSDRDLVLYVKSGSPDYAITTIKIPLTAGSVDTIPPINLLASSQFPANVDAQGNRYMYLTASAVLRGACGTTITAAKVINLFIQSADY